MPRPMLRRFALTGGTCGGPGFLYTASTDPSHASVGSASRAEVDTGPNPVRGQITVQPTQVMAGSGIAPVTVDFDTTGGGRPDLTTVAGDDHDPPNATTDRQHVLERLHPGRPDVLQRLLAPDDRQGRTGSKGTASRTAATAAGTFQGETVSGVAGDIQQSTYMADPLGSTPLVAASVGAALDLLPRRRADRGVHDLVHPHGGRPGAHRHVARLGPGERQPDTGDLLRQRPGTAARQRWGTGSETAARSAWSSTSDRTRAHPPPGRPRTRGTASSSSRATSRSIAKGAEDRFACTPNNWVTGGPLPYDEDPRWAYIILTELRSHVPRGKQRAGSRSRACSGSTSPAGTSRAAAAVRPTARTTTSHRAATTPRARSSGATS